MSQLKLSFTAVFRPAKGETRVRRNFQATEVLADILKQARAQATSGQVLEEVVIKIDNQRRTTIWMAKGIPGGWALYHTSFLEHAVAVAEDKR